MSFTVRVNHVRVKNLLSPTKLGADFVINPYVGCLHGCIYCYAACIARARLGRTETWGEYLDVKDAPAVDLAKVFRKTILLSSMTDAYNPYESEAMRTREILSSLLPAQPKIRIITKSALVTRDIDLLRRFPSATVIVSFSSLDDNFRRIAEPRASSPQDKIAALKMLKEEGIETAVMLAPIFPRITDHAAIIEAAAPYVSYMTFDTLNMRPQNKDALLSFAAALRPELKGLYEDIYIRHNKGFFRFLREEIREACRRYGVKGTIYF